MKACQIAGTPELVGRLMHEFEDALNSARVGVALALRSRFAERRRGLLRGITSFIPRLVARIASGGGRWGLTPSSSGHA